MKSFLSLLSNLHSEIDNFVLHKRNPHVKEKITNSASQNENFQFLMKRNPNKSQEEDYAQKETNTTISVKIHPATMIDTTRVKIKNGLLLKDTNI